MKQSIAILLVALLAGAASPALATDSIDPDLRSVMTEWARIKYEAPEGEVVDRYQALAARAEQLVQRHPERAEPRIWEAIVRASLAGSMGGIRSLFSALPEVKRARTLLLEAERIDPEALDGSVYTSLGSLYYQVPGSPIGFGDPDQALVYLERAVELSPDGIDSNFFMGDYWARQGDTEKARRYLERALAAKPRPERPLADSGRRAEIQQALRSLPDAAR